MPGSGEAMQMETPSVPGRITFHKGSGCYVTRKLGVMLCLFFVASLVTTAALAVYFTSCAGKAANESSPGTESGVVGDETRGDGSGKGGISRGSVRLPRSVLPDSYVIKLVPFLFDGNFTFRGEVMIVVNVTEETGNVTLHANNIEVDAGSVKVRRRMTEDDGAEVPIERLGNNTEQQFFIIHLGERLVAGEQYEIRMTFTGDLNDKLQGFYRSSYTVGNTTRWIATTQFQATDARRAFPCFDEPAMKAKFKLFIGRPKNMTSLSNMPQTNNGKPVLGLPDYVWDEYAESVPMSTYLVAFVVSDFVRLQSPDGFFSVWARKEAISQSGYSLEIGPKCLKYFEEYFDIDFPLPKVDMIALPDFAAGAMENWGLITFSFKTGNLSRNIPSVESTRKIQTFNAAERLPFWVTSETGFGIWGGFGRSYRVHGTKQVSALHGECVSVAVDREKVMVLTSASTWVHCVFQPLDRETAMLYEEGVSTRHNKQRVATVISHELAHQWFGNLVTPSWWSDLWLNEGFASYVEYLGVEAVEPSWKILEQFVVQETQNVFALDALQTSHPISIQVHHPDEISEIFDKISYGKGASLLRMMDHFLTSNVFKSGLTRYLKRHKYSNAEQDDLWKALTEQAHEDRVLSPDMSVKTIMDTWTLQTGFPVVTVKRDYEANLAVVTQDKFLLYQPQRNSSSLPPEEETLWWIPLTYTTSDALNFTSTYPSHWMKQEKSITIRGLPSSRKWVLFNILETGFYRVNYDQTNWKLLIEHLKNASTLNEIIATNRAQLIDDALNLARAGLLDYGIALDVTRYLHNELDSLPWNSAFVAFSYLDDMLLRTAAYDKFKKYILMLIENLYNEVGFRDSEDDPQLVVYKRVDVLSWACALDHKDCVNYSVELFGEWMRTKNPDVANPISPNLKSIVYCTAIRVGGEEEWNFAWERYLRSNVGSEKGLLLEALGCSEEMWILRRYLDWALSENHGIRKQDLTRVFSALTSSPIGQTLAFNFLRGNWQRLRDYLGPSLFGIGGIVRAATSVINNKLEMDDLIQFSKDNSHDLGAATRAVEQAIEKAAANIRWMECNYEAIVNWLSNATGR